MATCPVSGVSTPFQVDGEPNLRWAVPCQQAGPSVVSVTANYRKRKLITETSYARLSERITRGLGTKRGLGERDKRGLKSEASPAQLFAQTKATHEANMKTIIHVVLAKRESFEQSGLPLPPLTHCSRRAAARPPSPR